MCVSIHVYKCMCVHCAHACACLHMYSMCIHRRVCTRECALTDEETMGV